YCFFFFFQAEDGIRDFHVTGVQTCALPISGRISPSWWTPHFTPPPRSGKVAKIRSGSNSQRDSGHPDAKCRSGSAEGQNQCSSRSEERRVGKEWRSRWSAWRRRSEQTGAQE